MAKVTFASLKLKRNNEVNIFTLEDKEIEVKKYLPFQDKYNMIMSALEKSLVDEIYNDIKLGMYLELYIVYNYTNITFTEKQKENEENLYDILASNGVIEQVMKTMEADELNFIYDAVENIKEDYMDYKLSITGMVDKVMNSDGPRIEEMTQLLESFNPEDYEAVIDFAEAANAVRPIN